MVQKNIEYMNRLEGFDVVIICCSSLKQADYWQARLESGKGSILSSNSTVLSVEEDWVGGAGNGEQFNLLHLQSVIDVNTFSCYSTRNPLRI